MEKNEKEVLPSLAVSVLLSIGILEYNSASFPHALQRLTYSQRFNQARSSDNLARMSKEFHVDGPTGKRT